MAGAGREMENDKRVFLFPLCLLPFIFPLAEVICASVCFAVPVAGQVGRKPFLLLCPRGGPVTSMKRFAFLLGPDMHWCPERGQLFQRWKDRAAVL